MMILVCLFASSNVHRILAGGALSVYQAWWLLMEHRYVSAYKDMAFHFTSQHHLMENFRVPNVYIIWYHCWQNLNQVIGWSQLNALCLWGLLLHALPFPYLLWRSILSCGYMNLMMIHQLCRGSDCCLYSVDQTQPNGVVESSVERWPRNWHPESRTWTQ